MQFYNSFPVEKSACKESLLSINLQFNLFSDLRLVPYRFYCDGYLEGQSKAVHTVGQDSVL